MSRSEMISATFDSASLIEESSEVQNGGKPSNGRWTKEEHQRFVEAIKVYGKNWKKVEEFVGTRTGAQIRSHAQKFFLRLEKEVKTKQQMLTNANQSVSVRKISEGSISTHHTQPENVKSETSEDSLKDNLPLREASEVSIESKLAASKKSFTKSNTASSFQEAQAERSVEQQKNGELLEKIQRSQEELREFDLIVKNLMAIYLATGHSQIHNSSVNSNITNNSGAPKPRKLHPHEIFSNHLMDYFSKFNKSRQTLKLSDMVELSTEKTTSDDEAYEFPVKKVKQF